MITKGRQSVGGHTSTVKSTAATSVKFGVRLTIYDNKLAVNKIFFGQPNNAFPHHCAFVYKLHIYPFTMITTLRDGCGCVFRHMCLSFTVLCKRKSKQFTVIKTVISFHHQSNVTDSVRVNFSIIAVNRRSSYD